MDSESAKFYFAPTQYRTLYLQIVSKWMLTGKRSNQLRHGGGFCLSCLGKVYLFSLNLWHRVLFYIVSLVIILFSLLFCLMIITCTFISVKTDCHLPPTILSTALQFKITFCFWLFFCKIIHSMMYEFVQIYFNRFHLWSHSVWRLNC